MAKGGDANIQTKEIEEHAKLKMRVRDKVNSKAGWVAKEIQKRTKAR